MASSDVTASALSVVNRDIDGPHGPIPLRVYRTPSSGQAPGLVWLQGGAWISGGLDNSESDWVARRLAERGLTVVTVSYRLANDGVRFPIPADDCFAAYGWVTAHTDELGIDHDRLALGGASAGANLAASAALRLRDEGGRAPSGLVLVYPLLHAVIPEPTPEYAERLAALPPRAIALNAALGQINLNYAGSADVFADPYAFPGVGRLDHLPPVFVLNADVDLLRLSGEEFAAGVAIAGGDVTNRHEPGTMHGYFSAPDAPAVASIGRIAHWLGVSPLAA